MAWFANRSDVLSEVAHPGTENGVQAPSIAAIQAAIFSGVVLVSCIDQLRIKTTYRTPAAAAPLAETGGAGSSAFPPSANTNSIGGLSTFASFGPTLAAGRPEPAMNATYCLPSIS